MSGVADNVQSMVTLKTGYCREELVMAVVFSQMPCIWSSVIMQTELVGWRKAALSLCVKVVMQTPLPAAPHLPRLHQMPLHLLRGKQAGGSQMLHKLHEVANDDGYLESMW